MNSFEQEGLPIQTAWPRDAEPGLCLIYLGWFRSRGDFLWEQVSPTYCIHYVQRGRGIFEVDGKRYDVEAGGVFIFHPGMHIVYYDFPETPWHYIWFRLEGRSAAWALADVGMGPTHPYRNMAGNREFEQLLNQIRLRLQRPNHSATAPNTLAWQLIEALRAGAPARPQPPRDLAESCRLALESRLDYAPSVDELAAEFGVNRSTLFRAFKTKYRIAPKDYIDALRFEKARSLLERTSQDIKQIAQACGFNSPAYFSAAFRKRFGQPPNAWRHAHAPAKR